MLWTIFFQEQRWTDTFLSLHVKKFKRIILFLLIAFSATGAKAQSDVKFNDGVRYSQWVIDSRMNDFYANTTHCGFAVYNQEGTQTSPRVDGKTKLDYVVGLVAKSIIEASQYYSQYDWAKSFAKPWFLSIQNYGDYFYNQFRSTSGSLDDLNAVKLFIPLRALTETKGKYPDATTFKHTTTALNTALSGLKTHNSSYSIKSGTTAETAGNIVAGGWWHKSTYVDQMWLDGAYMGPALFAELVNYSNKTTNIDATNDWELIVKQFTILRSMCWNPTDKLLYHAFAADGGTNSTSHSDTWEGLSHTSPYCFHSASYWGRAVGWYFLALVDILEQMEKAKIPSTDSKFTTLKGYLEETAEGIKARQDKTTGGWYQILDEDNKYSESEYNNGQSHTTTNNYIESSATALFTAAYLKAIRLKYLNESTYKSVAESGYKCLVNQFFSVDADHKVNIFGSCRSAGLGGSGDDYIAGASKYRNGSKAYYLLGSDVAKVEKTENKTEGKVMGAFIMAATEYERANEKAIRFSYDLAPFYTLGSPIKAEALGSGEISYQWCKSDDSPVSGATSESFTPKTSGSYYCKATSTQGDVTTTIKTSTTAVIKECTVTLNATDITGYPQILKYSGTALNLPTPEKTDYTFYGWYTAEKGGNEVDIPYTPTDDITLYAQWTPKSELFTLKDVTSTKVRVNSGENVEVKSENATIKGGSAYLHNGHPSNPSDMIVNSEINLKGSGSSYLKITLNKTLQAGDEIIINPTTSSFILSADESTQNDKTVTGSYVIQNGDAVVEKNVIYLYRGNKSVIKDIKITRNYPESDSRATFTYNDAAIAFSEKTAGDKSVYTTTLEIGASKAGETITITPSKQDGATIKKDGSTVSGDITITAPSKTGNTDIHTYTVTSKDGSSTTTYIINVKVVKEKITLKYSDSNGNTEWTWNSTTTPTQPTFVQPTVKAYIKNAEGKDELLTDASLSYTYESDVTSVATVDASSGKITIAKSGNGGAKIYATLKENENYYADPAFFNVLLEQGYSFSVDANETAPAINTSKYITRTTAGGTEEKLVKMTFGGWKWEGYANKDATEKTLGSYKVVRGDKTTYYTDKWNDSGEKASDIASIDGHYYSWNGVNDAVDESKAASDEKIYGSIRYGWFKSPVHDSDGKTTVSYPYTLPVRGSFMTFEPTMNGTLTIYILQNGAWNTNNNGGTYVQDGDGSITYEKGDIIPGQFRPHAFQVVNQRGLTVQEFSPNYSVSTKQKVDSRYYCMFKGDEDYNETKYNNPYNVAKWTEFAKYMSTKEQKRAHDSWNSGPLGAQKIIELDNGSFLAVQKGIVKYTFHVTGNETYYFFSNFSKMGFSGANFVPDGSQPQETVSNKISTLELSDVTAYNKITATETGKNIEGTDLKEYTYKIGETEIAPVAGVTIPQFYSIKLKRTFKPNQWTTLSLPFNLTQTEVEQIFGKGTQIIVFDKAKITSARTYLTFFYHEIQNVLPGYPYLIRPTLVDANDNQMETKSNSADNTPTYTITKDGDKLTLTEFTVYNKAINPFIEQHEFKSGGYTAKCTPSYCTADVSGNNNSNYSMQYEKGDIFVSESNGTVYISEGKSYGKGYRSYIDKDKTGTTTTTAKALSISFSGVEDGDDNGTTTEIRVTELADDVIETLGIGGVYNLNGQKVADTTRNLPAGIYIVNGRKVVVK